jgi:hypothetical protein
MRPPKLGKPRLRDIVRRPLPFLLSLVGVYAADASTGYYGLLNYWLDNTQPPVRKF